MDSIGPWQTRSGHIDRKNYFLGPQGASNASNPHRASYNSHTYKSSSSRYWENCPISIILASTDSKGHWQTTSG